MKGFWRGFVSDDFNDGFVSVAAVRMMGTAKQGFDGGFDGGGKGSRRRAAEEEFSKMEGGGGFWCCGVVRMFPAWKRRRDVE